MPNAKRLTAALLGAIRDWVEPFAIRVGERLRDHDARLAALESAPQMRYVGTFKQGSTYTPGMVATHDGSMWHCQRTTSDRPGTSDAWVLAVKHGRDAR